MGISSNIKVTSDVDGFTLMELIDLIGDASKSKKILKSLEAATKESKAAKAELEKAEYKRINNVAVDNKKRSEDMNALEHKLSEVQEASAKLDTAREAANKYDADLKAKGRDIDMQKTQIDNLAAEIKAERNAMANARTKAEAEFEEIRKVLQGEIALAKELQEEAKQKMEEADAKVASLKKALD